MRLISSSKANSRGFTFIELSAVLVLIVLVAALIVPNYAHFAKALSMNDFRDGLVNLVGIARETAISQARTVSLEYEADGNVMQIVATNATDGSSQTLKTLAVPSGVSMANQQSDTQATDGAEWAVLFYPDGTAGTGGIEFSTGPNSFSLAIDADGKGSLVDGEIPSTKSEKWQAGDYEHRTQ